MSGAVLVVALDLRNPYSHLALGPTLELARSGEARIDWRPFEEAHLPRPPGPEPEARDRGARHRRYRAQYRVREIQTYAATQGIVLREPQRAAPTPGAHLAWLWLRAEHPERLPDFLLALFRGYGALELDVADAGALAALLTRVGADAGRFAAWARDEGDAALEAHQRALREAGVFQTPTYLLEGEPFVGRQHLPLLRWRLAGGRGPVPI